MEMASCLELVNHGVLYCVFKETIVTGRLKCRFAAAMILRGMQPKLHMSMQRKKPSIREFDTKSARAH